MNAILAILILCGMLLACAIPIYFVWKIFTGIKRQAQDFREVVVTGVSTTATVTRTRGGNPRVGDSAGGSHSPVAEYTFEVPGKGSFQGEFTTFDYEIGDEIEIEYSPKDPSRNVPAFLADEGRRTAPKDLPGLSGRNRESDPES